MNGSRLVPIWDIWTRLFHWTLAFTVLFLLYTGITGELFVDWHRRAGEFVLLLLLFRVLWGFVGSSNIRFNRLVRSPLEAFSHLRALAARDVPVEREHNAAGAWAVVALILIVGTQAVTGMFIADEDEIVEGALYGTFGSDLSNLLYRVHMINSDLIKIIVGLHVLMIVVYFFYARRNLLTPMFTGKLRWPESVPLPGVDFQRWWVGLICLSISVLGVGWLGEWW